MKSLLKTVGLTLTVVAFSVVGVAHAASSVPAGERHCCNRTASGCDCLSGADGDCSACRESNGAGTSATTTGGKSTKSGGGSGRTTVDKDDTSDTSGGKTITPKK